jgi:hypothetical protein
MRRRQEANEWSVPGGKRLIYADDWNPSFLRRFFFANERSLRTMNGSRIRLERHAVETLSNCQNVTTLPSSFSTGTDSPVIAA